MIVVDEPLQVVCSLFPAVAGAPHRSGTRLSEELCGLDARQHALDITVRAAAHRQRYSADPGQKAQAAQEEVAYMAEMDRLMTRIRAVEAQLLLTAERG
jgi:hypothetical protein